MFKPITGCPEILKDPAQSHLILGDACLTPHLLAPYEGTVQCVYLDPPFLTGEDFQMQMRVGETGMANGKPRVLLPAYSDKFESTGAYYARMRELLEAAIRLLSPTGTLFLHVDPRTSARYRILLDEMMGENAFCNEIIWAYQTGGRATKRFPSKHDVILMYRKSPKSFFSLDQVSISRREHRQNHMKRAVDEQGRSYRTIRTNGKIYTYYDDAPAYPTDVWTDISHIQQRDPQRTGYDTQKPVKLLERIIGCSTQPGDRVADLCCGSGTTLAAAAGMGRSFLGMDSAPAAIAAARKRLLDAPARIDWPAGEHGGRLDAKVESALGFYEVTLEGYTLEPEHEAVLQKEPAGFPLKRMDTVDQWAAGLMRGGCFHPFAHGVRTPLAPGLPRTLEVPMLSGQVALEIVDIMCRRHLFVWEA
ncbi:MAG: site-specific DNA-methyltransferase [Clostridia bacterium]|nr:site-specific DNA-methyltransferase [Clostridia bacterium]